MVSFAGFFLNALHFSLTKPKPFANRQLEWNISGFLQASQTSNQVRSDEAYNYFWIYFLIFLNWILQFFKFWNVYGSVNGRSEKCKRLFRVFRFTSSLALVKEWICWNNTIILIRRYSHYTLAPLTHPLRYRNDSNNRLQLFLVV